MADEIPQVPPIPKSVYRAAREASRESQEVDDRIACATEATWIRAWRAQSLTTDEIAEFERRFREALKQPAKMTVLPQAKACEHEGGEWQYGVRWDAHKATPIDWLACTPEQAEAFVAGHAGRATLVRRYIGPVVEAGSLAAHAHDFFEEDEPVADVRAAFERGEKGTT